MSYITATGPPKTLDELARREVSTTPAYTRLCGTGVIQGSDEWHAQRATSIGSSEAAAVFPSGISTTASPAELWSKLCGTPVEKVFDAYALAAMEQGKVMEPVLRTELATLLRRPIYEAGVFKTTCEGLAVSISASPDGLITNDDGTVVLAEFKWRMHASDWKGELGTTVFCQVQHQMHVIGCKSAYVYCGAHDERSLWLVQYSPSYFAMWLAWAQKLEQDVSNAKLTGRDKRLRSEAGSRAQTEEFLNLEKRRHTERAAPAQLRLK